ncbi:MAG: 50S ribosomal protein L4 [Firmicutes bacterium]|nr:50S ribosomal protein L4 [Bacillota bacterium]MDY5041660.1 50S ribosomal protein L4 [Eubacteriales bacterium]
MNVKVLNISGEEVGTLKLSDEVFKQEYNEGLIHQVVVAYLANLRQGTKSTLTRSEVRGHAKKPWRQKHTGHARQGSTKGPQWRGGGIVFAPKPRDFSKKVNKEAKRTAFKSAISTKLKNQEVIVVDKLNIEDAKTKLMANVLKNLKIDKSVVFVTKEKDELVMRASNNLPNVEVTNASVVNIYDIVSNDKVVLTQDAAKYLEEAYKG